MFPFALVTQPQWHWLNTEGRGWRQHCPAICLLRDTWKRVQVCRITASLCWSAMCRLVEHGVRERSWWTNVPSLRHVDGPTSSIQRANRCDGTCCSVSVYYAWVIRTFCSSLGSLGSCRHIRIEEKTLGFPIGGLEECNGLRANSLSCTAASFSIYPVPIASRFAWMRCWTRITPHWMKVWEIFIGGRAWQLARRSMATPPSVQGDTISYSWKRRCQALFSLYFSFSTLCESEHWGVGHVLKSTVPKNLIMLEEGLKQTTGLQVWSGWREHLGAAHGHAGVVQHDEARPRFHLAIVHGCTQGGSSEGPCMGNWSVVIRAGYTKYMLNRETGDKKSWEAKL